LFLTKYSFYIYFLYSPLTPILIWNKHEKQEINEQWPQPQSTAVWPRLSSLSHNVGIQARLVQYYDLEMPCVVGQHMLLPLVDSLHYQPAHNDRLYCGNNVSYSGKWWYLRDDGMYYNVYRMTQSLYHTICYPLYHVMM